MKLVHITFITNRLKNDFESLNRGRYEDVRLYNEILKAKDVLRQDPFKGVKVQRKLWPKYYVQKYQITNLWKYDLPGYWRLIYTIEANEVMVMNIILEWLDHKGYEKRFGY
ncbi:MAG: hypothetical protein KJ709_01695 [Nanoarchaeota archaeon]|nr:hypothetical protein [Nanoarchaeota archaeon]